MQCMVLGLSTFSIAFFVIVAVFPFATYPQATVTAAVAVARAEAAEALAAKTAVQLAEVTDKLAKTVAAIEANTEAQAAIARAEVAEAAAAQNAAQLVAISAKVVEAEAVIKNLQTLQTQLVSTMLPTLPTSQTANAGRHWTIDPKLLRRHRPFFRVVNQSKSYGWAPVDLCPLDALAEGENSTATQRNRFREKFLVYAPQFGLSNQLVALSNAAAWAQILNRTLVLPDLLAHGTISPRAPFGAAFNVSKASDGLSTALRVIEMAPFLRLGLVPSAVITLSTDNKFRAAGLEYLEAIGHGGLLEVRLGNMDFTPTSIFRAFGRCEDHDVLSFRSLYGAFHRSRGWLVYDPKRQGLVPGMQWLSRQAVPALLSPTDALRDVVRGISAQQHGGDGGDGGNAHPEFACAHVRQGDFVSECRAYDDEMLSPHTARNWVRAHHEAGLSCLQTEHDLTRGLEDLSRTWGVSRPQGSPLPVVYVSVEDPAIVKRLRARVGAHATLTTQSDYASIVRAGGLQLPSSLSAPLVDQLVCAQASRLLLNAYSTFSTLVTGWIGNQHPTQVGWELTEMAKGPRGQKEAALLRLGVHVGYWMQADHEQLPPVAEAEAKTSAEAEAEAEAEVKAEAEAKFAAEARAEAEAKPKAMLVEAKAGTENSTVGP